MYNAILYVTVLWLSYCRVLSIAETLPGTGRPVPRLDDQAGIILPSDTRPSLYGSAQPHTSEIVHRKVSFLDQSSLAKDVRSNETSLIEPSSQPSAQPSVAPSSQPSSLPSSQPTSVPTTAPTWQPTAVPSTQPTAALSSVEIVPTSTPSTQPSSLPTLQPSARPSQQPTSQPSAAPSRFQAPSMQPTSLPSAQPSEQPSSMPTVQPFAAPTALPSLQPTSVPSAQPSEQPSSRPSLQPSAYPTSRPSGQPTGQPTSSPSAVPSSMPSPAGEMGVTWWYLVTARCDLLASTPIREHNALEDVIYAFSQGLTDHLDNVERESVELTAVEISSESVSSDSATGSVTNSVISKVGGTTKGDSSRGPIEHRKLRTYPTIHQHLSYYTISKSSGTIRTSGGVHSLLRGVVSMRKHHKQSDPYKKSYTIETWCADHPTAVKVYETMELFGVDDTEILTPLHQRGMSEVTNITLSDLGLSTSEVAPPLDPQELSPVRITYIIVGTVVLFFIGVLFVSRMKHYKYFCSQTCIEDTARSWYNTTADGCMLCLRSVGLVSSDLRLYYGSGFDLTTQEEEADFYGETRSNLPSDNLDIHYGGDHRTLRAKYLEDDDETHTNNNNSSGGNTNNTTSNCTLNTTLPPKHGRIRAGLGKLFGKLRSTNPSTHANPNPNAIINPHLHPNTHSNGYAPAPVTSPRTRRSSHTGTYSPGNMSPVSSMIEMSERNGREVVSPITVPTRFSSSPHSSPPFGYDATYHMVHGGGGTGAGGSVYGGSNVQGRSRVSNGPRGSINSSSGTSNNVNINHNFYDHNEDSIDDLGGFTLAPITKPTARYKNVPADDYESYVV